MRYWAEQDDGDRVHVEACIFDSGVPCSADVTMCCLAHRWGAPGPQDLDDDLPDPF